MSDDDGPASPRRMVLNAHEQAARERERVSAAPMVPDDVLDTRLAEVEYHAAVMEYFNRLKPHLPDRAEYWERVALWAEPLDGARQQLAKDFARYYGVEAHDVLDLLDALERNQNFPEIQPREDDTVRGLRNLTSWRGRTETVTRERHDVIDGTVTETVTRPKHLPRGAAMRAHDALDEAAAALGYNVRPGEDVAETKLDGEAEEYEVEGVTTK
jgi:hypothetical protein